MSVIPYSLNMELIQLKYPSTGERYGTLNDNRINMFINQWTLI